MLRNIDAETACKILYELPVVLKTETVPLESSLSRITSADVFAKIPVPPFDRSPYDGYAFRGEDTQNAAPDNPVILKITEEIPAGKQPEYEITPGYAAKILTGAPIPKGADSTIKYELTEFTDTDVRIFNPVPPNTDVIYAGEDIAPGTLIAQAGTVITAPLMSMLANQGLNELEVYKKPNVTIINTGSELYRPGRPLPPAGIYNSSVYTLIGYLTDAGAAPADGGVVPDEPETIAARIDDALQCSDMVITTGGASVGDYDWAVKSAEMLGAEILFWKTNMKPGGSLMAAVCGGKLILGLSGNPAAAVLGLLRIALPYVRKLCGRNDCIPQEIEVMLKEPFRKSSPKPRILRGRLEIENARAYFAENIGQGNGIVSSLVDCDLLGEIPAGSPPMPAGTIIKAYRLYSRLT